MCQQRPDGAGSQAGDPGAEGAVHHGGISGISRGPGTSEALSERATSNTPDLPERHY